MNSGRNLVRVATHVTEADVSAQHIAKAKELGMEALGFLMMAHSAPVEKLVEQAKLMESYGAEAVYITDSAGALLPEQVRERVRALRQSLTCEVGFHAHNNLSLAVANTLIAIEEGATRIDSSVCGLGAGAGNTQTEVLTAVLDLMGKNPGIDIYKMMDLAEERRDTNHEKATNCRQGKFSIGVFWRLFKFSNPCRACGKEIWTGSARYFSGIRKKKSSRWTRRYDFGCCFRISKNEVTSKG